MKQRVVGRGQSQARAVTEDLVGQGARDVLSEVSAQCPLTSNAFPGWQAHPHPSVFFLHSICNPLICYLFPCVVTVCFP